MNTSPQKPLTEQEVFDRYSPWIRNQLQGAIGYIDDPTDTIDEYLAIRVARDVGVIVQTILDSPLAEAVVAINNRNIQYKSPVYSSFLAEVNSEQCRRVFNSEPRTPNSERP